MVSHIYIQLATFIAFVISLPVYILYLGMLRKFRNKKPFSSAFFKICCVLGIIDLINLTNAWLLNKFVTYRWFNFDKLVAGHSYFWGKLALTIGFWGGFGSTTSVLVMNFNRMTSIAFPLQHDLLWTTKFRRFIAFLQLGLPLLIIVPMVTVMDIDYLRGNNGTTISSGLPVIKEVSFHRGYYMVAFLYMIFVIIISIVMYTILFCKGKQNQVTPIGQNNQQNQIMRKTEQKMLIFAMVIFLLLCVMTVYFSLMATTSNPEKLVTYIEIYAITVDVYGWINPYLTLLLSKTVREHYKAFVLCKPIENGPTPQVRT